MDIHGGEVPDVGKVAADEIGGIGLVKPDAASEIDATKKNKNPTGNERRE